MSLGKFHSPLAGSAELSACAASVAGFERFLAADLPLFAGTFFADGFAADLFFAGATAFFPTRKAHLQRAHDVMAATAGASVAGASLDARKGRLEFAGAGSAAGRIVSASRETELNSQAGSLGRAIGEVQQTQSDWPEHSVVIVRSDGIDRDWHLSALPGLILFDAAVIAGWLIKERTVPKEDVTVVVLKLP